MIAETSDPTAPAQNVAPSGATEAVRPIRHGVVFRNTRVIDPESGRDEVTNVAVTGRRITAVTSDELYGDRVIDASGNVLTPGFIDLHSHAQTRPGLLLQALDGVTTALDLEMGMVDLEEHAKGLAEHGRPINYGFSASWVLARMARLDHVPTRPPFEMFGAGQRGPRWRTPGSTRERQLVREAVQQDLAAGAIGIGFLLGYAPETDPSEYRDLAQVAADHHVATFTHARYMGTGRPGAQEAIKEVVDVSLSTGAHMHVCHLNSSANRDLGDVLGTVYRGLESGARVTSEMYPYGSASTVIGAGFLAPDRLEALGIKPSDIFDLEQSRWLTDESDLKQMRSARPGSHIVFRWLDTEGNRADRELLAKPLEWAEVAIASDSMVAVGDSGALGAEATSYPPDARAHPRTAGCFATVFAALVRNDPALTLVDAVRRCTLLPVQILQETVPAMRRKGRVQPGCDADLVVFDPDSFTPTATLETLTPSMGMRYVMVGGELVVNGGVIDANSCAGTLVRAG